MIWFFWVGATGF